MNAKKCLNRLELPYKNDCKRWRFTREDIDKFQKRQYIFIYRVRINLLRGRILATANFIGISNFYVSTYIFFTF